MPRKRSAAAVAAAAPETTTNSKKQHAAAVLSLDADDNEQPLHHHYSDKPASDLTVTLIDATTGVQHIYHLHQAVLTLECTYFFTLTNSKDQQQHITVELPSTSAWTATDFDYLIRFCYRQLNDELFTLAHADSYDFIKLWYRKGAALQHQGAEYVVTDHYHRTKVTLHKQEQPTETCELQPRDCILGDASAFHDKLSAPLNLLRLLQTATYFAHSQLISLLTKILLTLIEMREANTLIDVAAVVDVLPLPQLRTACIDRMRSYIRTSYSHQRGEYEQTYGREELTGLSSQFVLDLLLPEQLYGWDTNRAAHQSNSSITQSDDDSHAKKLRMQPPDAVSDEACTQHHYATKPASDLTVTLTTESSKHIYHLHQVIMALDNQYFTALVDNQDSADHINVTLPPDFVGSPTALDQYIKICYRRLDHIFVSLVCAANRKAFAAMWLRKGALVKNADDTTKSSRVVGHQKSGGVLIAADNKDMPVVAEEADEKAEDEASDSESDNDSDDDEVSDYADVHYVGDCILDKRSAFHEQLDEPMDVLMQLRLAKFFENPHLLKLLLKVVHKVISILQPPEDGEGSALLLKLVRVADELSHKELRSTCIRKMRKYDWRSFKRELAEFSADFVLKILLKQ